MAKSPNSGQNSNHFLVFSGSFKPIMTITLYGIPNCDTVKKARAWLTAHGITHEFHDFKKLGVPAELDAWEQAAGWQKLLNKAGTTFKKLSDAEKAAIVDAASAKALMRAQSSVIKRPVVQWADGSLSVGFDDAVFKEKMAVAQRVH
jgi:arsenate reductase (glutaredoxin)